MRGRLPRPGRRQSGTRMVTPGPSGTGHAARIRLRRLPGREGALRYDSGVPRVDGEGNRGITMSGSNGVAIVGGCGHVGLPLGPRVRRAAASTSCSTTSNERSVAVVNEGTHALRRAGRARGARRGARRGPAAGVEPTLDVIGERRARRRRHRHARSTSTSTPTSTRCPRRSTRSLDYLRDGQLLVLRSTVYPGVTALVERLVARARARRRRGVLSGAHRRGQGDGRAVRAPADRRRRARRARSSGPGSCSATSPTRSS